MIIERNPCQLLFPLLETAVFSSPVTFRSLDRDFEPSSSARDIVHPTRTSTDYSALGNWVRSDALNSVQGNPRKKDRAIATVARVSFAFSVRELNFCPCGFQGGLLGVGDVVSLQDPSRGMVYTWYALDVRFQQRVSTDNRQGLKRLESPSSRREMQTSRRGGF